MKHEYYTCDRCGRKVDIAYRLYAVGGDESKPLADIDLCSDGLYEVKDLITRPVDQTEKVPAPAAEAVAAPPSEEIGKPSTASARSPSHLVRCPTRSATTSGVIQIKGENTWHRYT